MYVCNVGLVGSLLMVGAYESCVLGTFTSRQYPPTPYLSALNFECHLCTCTVH